MRQQGKHVAPHHSKRDRRATSENRKADAPAVRKTAAPKTEKASASKNGYFARLREQSRQGSFWLWLGVGAALMAILGFFPM